MQANMAYSVLKDGRDLFLSLQSIPEDERVGPLFNFYAAAHHQWELGILTQQQWAPIEREIVLSVRDEMFSKFWTTGRAKLFPDSFVKHLELLLDEVGCNGCISKHGSYKARR